MTSVLVAYASAHGSTKGIAKMIGDRLSRAGLFADVRPIDEVDALDNYDAAVIGSAIHNQTWLAPAAAFVKSRATDLSKRPVWLFSVSSIGETSSFFGPKVSKFFRRLRKESPEMSEFRMAIHPRDHRHFAGAVQPADWGRFGSLFLTLLGGTHGDHRDWEDIGAWADAIAQSVQPADRPRNLPDAQEQLHP